MKGHRKILIAVAALIAVGGVLVLCSGHGARTAAEQTRLALSKQGFKLDLSDFDSASSEEMDDRIAALGLNNRVGQAGRILFLNNSDLMTPVGGHGAVVIWKQGELANPSGFTQLGYIYNHEAANDIWPLLRDQLEEERLQLNNAAAAILSGPIRYPLNLRAGGGLMLSHLAGLRRLTDKFSSRTVMALHDDHKNAAWTNLLAATRLVTAWDMEPIEVSQAVRCACLETVYGTTWQALQAGDWPEEQLAQLQREWESLDLMKGLPDTVAYTGASDLAAVSQERLQPAPASSPMANPFKFPRRAFDDIMEHWRDQRYRSTGTYVDEKDLLLFYHDRIMEMRSAVQSRSWGENAVASGRRSRANVSIPIQEQSFGGTDNEEPSPDSVVYPTWGLRSGRTVAEAEARRRLIIVAIALERFHRRSGSYPKSLTELAPDYLKTAPIDFMDGKPLRYVVTENGHFYMYSVGLECVDKGGKIQSERDAREAAQARMRGGSTPPGGELVWPSPGPQPRP